MERSPFGRRPVDTMDEARRCSDILTAYKLDCKWRIANKTGDPVMLNLAVEAAKRDMEAAAAVNRKNIKLVWTNPNDPR